MTIYKGSTAQSELSQGSNAFVEAYRGNEQVFKIKKNPSFYCYSCQFGDTFYGYYYTKNIVESIGEVVAYFKNDQSLATKPSELTETSTLSVNEIISNGFVFKSYWFTTYYYRYPDGDI